MQNRVRDMNLKLAVWVGIGSNLFLFLVKGVVGLVGNSTALIADAFHSASDVISSIVVLIGIYVARKPPDYEHPYGHGKAEVVSAIIVSVLLAVVAIELLIHSVRVMVRPPEVPSSWVLYVILFSILLKEGLYRYKMKTGRRYNSQALIADAWHHRSDALSSIAVLAGAGLALSADILDAEWLLYADPLAGTVISIMILYMAWKVGYEAVNRTLDYTLHREETELMRDRVLQVDGVMGIDSFRAREHGPYLIVDIKISVPSELSVEEGHAIGKEVKSELMKLEQIEDVFVHVNPHPENRNG